MRLFPTIAVLFLAAFLSCRPGGAQSTTSPLSGKRPNIILILADDLGYGELGCYGQKAIQTPRLDRMASEGVRFTQCYAGSAICAPSRAVLMSGLHTGHTRIRSNKKSVLRTEDKILPEVLKQAGYSTAHFGKWGLGEPGSSGDPNRKGFDEFLGYTHHNHAHDYTPEFLWKNGEKLPLEPGTYAPDLFTSAALEYVSRPHSSPFFLYLAYTYPHANNELGRETGNGMEVPDDAPYSKQPWPQPQKNHAAMITRMDADIGLLLDLLRQKGLERDTVVFFTSDNGPHREGGARPDFFDSNGVLRGIKRDLYEGGIRVPMIAWGPALVEPGRISEKAWGFWDFLPTAADLAGVSLNRKVDGLSMAGELSGARSPDHDYLYWELKDISRLGSFQGFQQALRLGDWKVVRRGEEASGELYHLPSDPGETKNVAAEHPEIMARAAKLFRTVRTAPEAAEEASN